MWSGMCTSGLVICKKRAEINQLKVCVGLAFQGRIKAGKGVGTRSCRTLNGKLKRREGCIGRGWLSLRS